MSRRTFANFPTLVRRCMNIFRAISGAFIGLVAFILIAQSSVCFPLILTNGSRLYSDASLQKRQHSTVEPKQMGSIDPSPKLRPEIQISLN